jgi:predicted ATPase
MRVKGKREPVPVALLLGKSRASPDRFPELAPMVGREKELASLLEAVAPIFNIGIESSPSSEEENHPTGGKHSRPTDGETSNPAQERFAGLVYIYGEAGIGKSRLVHELRQELRRQGRIFQWFDCPSEQILRQSLYPFKHFLRRYFQQELEGAAVSPDENRRRFERVLADLLARLEGPGTVELCSQLERTRSMLGALVGLHWDDSLYERLEPKYRFENTLAALRALILAESLLQPVVVHVENAHWLDPDSLAFLKTLTRQVAPYPFVVLLSGRYCDEEECFSLEPDEQVKQQALEIMELSSRAVAEMATQVLAQENGGVLPVGDDLGVFLTQKTNGNPLFLEQILLDLHERDLVKEERGAWALAGKGVDKVPTSLTAVLIARLDRLDAHVRVVVQTAAVLGLEFDVPVLRSMLLEDKNLSAVVEQAQQRMIWAAISEMRYLFRQALMRDAAYDMQPHTRLSQAHARAAVAIQQVHHPDLNQYYDDLAYHYEQAQDPRQAFVYARLAGEFAAAQFANSQAADYFDMALKNAAGLDPKETLAERQSVHASLGELLVTIGGYQDASQHLEQALELAQEQGDGDAQARACRWLARLHESRSEYPQALEWIERGLEILAGRETAEAAELSNYAGLVYSRQGDYPQALEHARRGMRIAEKLGATVVLARNHNLLGHLARLRGESAEAVGHFQQALDLYQNAGDIAGQATSQNQIANAYYGLGRWSEAREYFDQARRTFEEIGDVYNRAFVENNLGQITLNQGQVDQALDYYQHGLSTLEQIGGSAYVLGAFHNNVGAAYLQNGELELANHHLEASQAYFEEAGARDWLPELHRHRAHLALLSDNLNAAFIQADQALGLARELHMRSEEGNALRVLGKILLAQGQLQLAEESLLDSLTILGEIEDEYESARSQLALAGLYAVLGRSDELQEALEACIPVFERLGARPDLSTAQNLLPLDSSAA